MADFALIPAYNEENHIEEVLRRLQKVDHIIPLVVDDGSKDRTAALARRNGAIVIRHPRNKGKGEALRTGFRYLLKKGAKHVVVVDSDLQFFPEESSRILRALRKGADFVCGYRNFSKIPVANRLGNMIWIFTFNLLFGSNFKDTNSGFIGLDRKAMSLLKDKVDGGYIIDNAIRAEAVKNNLKISQVPVSIVYHKKRNINTFAKMFFGNFIFIIKEGIKYRLGIK
jgi:glycosyltransferase involved in cell wall biosynthesis